MHSVCSFTNPMFYVNGSLGDNSPQSWSCLARCGALVIGNTTELLVVVPI